MPLFNSKALLYSSENRAMML